MNQFYDQLNRLAGWRTVSIWSFLILAALSSIFSCQFGDPAEKPIVFEPSGSDHFFAEAGNYSLNYGAEAVVIATLGEVRLSKMELECASEAIPKLEGAQLFYREVYPDIDWTFYDKGFGEAGYDFVLKPGAEPADIKLILDNAGNAYLSGRGELVIPVEGGEIVHSAPIAYQEIGEKKTKVDCRFALSEGKIGFELGDYNAAWEVVIDPTISFRENAAAAAVGSMMMDITGTVFRDYNGDGVQQGGEPGREGIIVKAYADGVLPTTDAFLGQTVTDASGNYTLTPASYPVRLEFEIPTGLCNLDPDQDFPAQAGLNPMSPSHGSAVQFADGPGVYNYNINYPADYAFEENPFSFAPCYINGDPLTGGNAGDSEVFVRFRYQDDGHGANSGYDGRNGGPYGPPHDIVANGNQLGTVWGVAYSRQSRQIFTSAFLKRHAGLGPLGTGGIYMIDSDDFGTSKNYDWLDFDNDLNIPTSDQSGAYVIPMTAPGSNEVYFSPVVGSNADRGLSGDKFQPSRDAAAWEQVGRVSFGDIDISEDGRYLFTMNLYDRKLYVIDLEDPVNPVAPVAADVGTDLNDANTKVVGYDLPNPCAGPSGESRPWALKFSRGKVYVGLVCSAQDATGNTVGTPTDLNAYVYEFDLATQTFDTDPALSFNLNYRTANPWKPWTNDWVGCFECDGYPILSDIEFDSEGNMLLGLLDRRGHQAGWYNHDLNGNGFTPIATVGDILRAVRDTDSDECEFSIIFEPEYYQDNKYHQEPTLGGLSVHRTSDNDNVLSAYMDPVWIWSGGVMRFDNKTGAQIGNGYELYYNVDGGVTGPFGKAAGIGDIETIQEVPPLEIGNRIWADIDRDGIQDAGEPGINGVLVQLKDAGGTVLATTTTASDGNYYFNQINVPDGDTGTPGDQAGPQRYTTYQVCVPIAEFGVGKPLYKHKVTPVVDAVGNSAFPERTDNDATEQPNGDLLVDMVTTADWGENDHSYDIGVIPTDWGDLPDTYLTSDAADGPWHWITPELYLGNCVDSENTGVPDTEAEGDNDNPAVRVATVPSSAYPCDDEDGITFVTPMLAGYEACIEVSAINETGADAVLQAWIDFDGSGTFDMGEEIVTGDFEPTGAAVPDGGLVDELLCFDVPLTATFEGGMAMVRFRLSPTGSLMSSQGGDVDGEVEDYKLPLGKVGNLVWDDRDFDGVQDAAADEPGINGIDVQLIFAGPNGTLGDGDDRTYNTTTATVGANDGIYSFCGLVNGTYEISISTGREPTLLDQTGEESDSDDGVNGEEFTIADVTALTTGESGTSDLPGTFNGFPDNQDDLRYDFGFVGTDYGDLPDSYKTTAASGGAFHTTIPDKFLGSCVDLETDGNPGDLADGDNGAAGTDSYPVGPACTDDEDGIEFLTPLVPGSEACIEVVYTVGTGSGTLNGWIDFDNDGTFDQASDKLVFNTIDGGANPGGANVALSGTAQTIELCFTVPATATFTDGEIYARFRLGCEDDMASSGLVVGGEVEDYRLPLAKIGNLVWEDVNANGQQDEAADRGINGLTIEMTWGGPDNDVTTTGDNIMYTTTTANDGTTDGIYYFCGLIPGKYNVRVPTDPTGMVITAVDVATVAEDEDSDDHSGTMVMINDPIGQTTGEGGTGDNPGSINDFPDNQDDLVVDFGYRTVDWGDLPDSYLTTSPTGPSHKVDADLLLGSCIDGEANGDPDAMAGRMTGGDDNNTGIRESGTCTAGDDEDGVEFMTPLIPGFTSCINVTAINNTGATAILQAWIDFDGDGVFQADEQLATGAFTGGGAAVLNGGLNNEELCFEVPADATFEGGNAFMRFRLSSSGGLDAGGAAEDGEVEDYKIPLGKVGNRVWEDRNYNGIQDVATTDPGIDDIEVQLTWAGPNNIRGDVDDEVYSVTTATIDGKQGAYYFCGLIAGNYELKVITSRYPTLLDQTTEDLDSDDGANGEEFTILDVTNLITGEAGIDDMPGMVNDFPDDQDDLRFDFGYVGLDYGDLPDEYGTLIASSGAVHTMLPDKFLGSCVDLDLEGQPDDEAAGDDDAAGVFSFPIGTTCTDDEDGIRFVTPLFPGSEACIEVRYTADNGAGYLNGWMDFDNDGSFAEAGDQLDFTSIDGVPNPDGTNVTLTGVDQTSIICFDVPAGATLDGGEVYARFRLGCQPDMPSTGLIVGGEVEDYHVELAKVGNLVWFDRDIDGIQDEGEAEYGLNDVPVTLQHAGADGILNTDDDGFYPTTTGNHTFASGDDIDGIYYYCGLVEGKYQIIVDYDEDAGFEPTLANIGEALEDDRDSDGVEVMDNGGDPIPGVFGVMFEIDNLPGLPTGENGIGDQDISGNGSNNDVANFPDLKVDQRFDFGLQDPDYGDLPEGPGFNYATSNANDGPKHTIPPAELRDVIPYLYLGQTVDQETDGNPTNMADGDDEPGDDDEDGVRLVTPLVPGYQACVEVTVNIPVAPALTVGYLQGWIDFNGNGTFDASEQVIDDLPFPFNVLTNGLPTEVCFDVPEDAQYYDGGLAFARFRISTQKGLGYTGCAIDGEVEDYRFDLAKVGNLVWEDRNYDGLQDGTEPVLEGVAVQLTFAGADQTVGTSDDLNYNTTTDENGRYYFCGLIDSDYKLTVTAPEGMHPVPNDQGAEDLDSDGLFTDPTEGMVMETFTLDLTAIPATEGGLNDQGAVDRFPDEISDETHDFAFVGIDFGDLPDSYATQNDDDGPKHIVDPTKRLGDCVDGEMDANPTDLATGDNEIDGGFDETDGCREDEDGVRFVTPLIAGYEACIELTSTLPVGGGFLNAFIDYNGNGQFDAPTEYVEFTKADGVAITGSVNGPVGAGDDVITQLCFTVPDNVDPLFPDGLVFARFRLSCEGDLGPEGILANGNIPAGEVEDYRIELGKVGNLVWEDRDYSGIQDDVSAEPGMNDVTVILTFAGADESLGTTDDRTYETTSANVDGLDGIYTFCGLIPGTYQLETVDPEHWTPTRADRPGISEEDDADNTEGVVFVFGDPISKVIGEEGRGDKPGTNGYPDSRDDQRFDFGYAALDLGDLPDAFGTTVERDGPKHVINPGLFLGACVNAEVNGAPDANAEGDDTAPSNYSQPNGEQCTDDENGIRFLEPLVPGYEACIEVTSSVETGQAYLNAFIDFNGDGDFVNDPNDYVYFTKAGAQNLVTPISNLPLPQGTYTQVYCFKVPEDASFEGGETHLRFRISYEGNLGYDALAMSGEVEDYRLPLAKIGNYVWEDGNLDGEQQAEESGLNDIGIRLTYTGENGVKTFATTTVVLNGVDGQYQFCGLIPGDYNLEVIEAPEGFIPAIPDNGPDDVDTDGTPDFDFTIPEGFGSPTGEAGIGDNDGALDNFPDDQVDETLDFGFIPVPEIKSALAIKGVDYPESGTCGHFNVTFDACIKNTGGTPLKDIEAILDLSAPEYFGAAYVGMVTAPEVISSDAQSDPVLNPTYAGSGDLFSDNGLLYPGEQFCVRFTIEVAPEFEGAPVNPIAQMVLTADAVNYQDEAIPDFDQAGDPFVANDLSDDGMDPMTANPGSPGNTGGEDDPTPLTDCWKKNEELAANDNINVTLNASCEILITPDDVLENHFADCDQGVYPLGGYYRVELLALDGQGILPNPIDATQFVGQEILVKIINVARQCEPTWGTITLEDKTTGEGCIRKVVALHKQLSDDYYAGDVFPYGGSKLIDGKYYVYDPVTSEEEDCDDMILDKDYLTDPNTHLLICTDVDSILNREASWLDKEFAYYTGFPEVNDNCDDIELVLVYDHLENLECAYAVDPMVPNRQVSHQIIRTFRFVDGAGHEFEVEQVICFFRPKIFLPDCKVHLDPCAFAEDDALLPDVIESEPYFVNAACMKMPFDDHLCGLTVTYTDQQFPGLEKCGDKVIRNWTVLDWCWQLIPEYTFDIVAIDGGGTDHCPELNFSDWHNKSLVYEQHLVVGDEEDPEIYCPENGPLVVSTGPFACEAMFEVPAPIVDNKKCGYNWTVEVYANVPVLWHGVPTGDYVTEHYQEAVVLVDIDPATGDTKGVLVSGVPIGFHHLVYVVEDHCGNTGRSGYCDLVVLDEIEPVAICNDDLTVSVTSNPSDDEDANGVGRVYAADVDEGSYDNCSEVYLQVRRFVPEECVGTFASSSDLALEEEAVTIDKPGTLADGQKGYWTVWADYVDFVCCDAGGHEEANKVLVELGVWDNANRSVDAQGSPIFQDAAVPFTSYGYMQEDNFNTCWLEVLIEDKVAPICRAPHDLALSCEDVPYEVYLPEDGTKWADLDSVQQENLKSWFADLQEANGSYPEAYDNCSAEIEMVDVTFDLHCGAGTITRYFQASDAWGRQSANCEQTITLSRHHDYCIQFPADTESHCEEGLAEIPGVELTENGCDLLAVSIQDERFDVPAGDGACFKLFRTYRVLNWCQFDEDVDPGTPLFDRFDSDFDMEPLVVGRDEDQNGIPGDQDVYVHFVGWDYSEERENEIRRYYDEYGLTDYVIGESATEGVTFIDQNCDPADYEHYDPTEGYWRAAHYTKGFYQYTQVVKVFDDAPPVVTAAGEERFPAVNSVEPGDKDDAYLNGLPTVCVGKVSREIEIYELCSPDQTRIKTVYLLANDQLGLPLVTLYENGAVTSDGSSFGFEIKTGTNDDSTEVARYVLHGDFPIGIHEFEVHAQDGCGNVDAENVPFEVFDDKAPAPICLGSLSVELMPDAENGGAMTVWANDFVASEIWDCSEPIQYTLHRADDVDQLEAAGQVLVPDFDLETSLTVTCSDPEVVRIYVYAWDAAGNGDRCETMLLVSDFMELCAPGSQATVAGLIATEEDLPLTGVQVFLSGGSSAETMTPEAGNYVLSAMEVGYDYTVTPHKDDDHTNGVSTLDLVIITKHILKIAELDSPYKLIAADVNNSLSITALDLIQLRKLILRVDDQFRSNTSWRFVDAKHAFKDAGDPWKEQLPEIININDLQEAIPDADFVAIKIGDVTGDAKVNTQEIESRTLKGTFQLELQQQTLKAGQEERIVFKARDLDAVQGYQFTLNLSDAVEFVDIEYGRAKEDHFGLTHLDAGVITSSWNASFSESTEADHDHLFTLVVRAHQTIPVHEVLNVNSRYTPAEAYDENADLLNVELAFTTEAPDQERFELYQNKPNPFDEHTVISFYLPKASNATVTIHDVTGKILKIIRRDFDKGYHEVPLKGARLPEGIVYYSLRTDDYRATRRMIVQK